MIKIQKNIPIPIRSKGFHKYPWHEMAVGDSFFIAYPTRAIFSRKQQKLYKMRITSRNVTENNVKGRRYWMVA